MLRLKFSNDLNKYFLNFLKTFFLPKKNLRKKIKLK